MSRRRRRPATHLATQTMELGFAVPEVITHRLVRMASAGSWQSAADREEFLRMSAEKFSAFYESWLGMFLAAHRANLRLFWSAPAWSAAWLGGSHRAGSVRVQRAALEILASGVAPIHRRAIANAKRLRK
jgi:hypothetical protein